MTTNGKRKKKRIKIYVLVSLLVAILSLLVIYFEYIEARKIILTGKCEGYNNKITFAIEDTQLPVNIEEIIVSFPKELAVDSINLKYFSNTLLLSSLREFLQNRLSKASNISECETDCKVPVIVQTSYTCAGKLRRTKALYYIYYSYTLHKDFLEKLPTVTFQELRYVYTLSYQIPSKVLENEWNDERTKRGYDLSEG